MLIPLIWQGSSFGVLSFRAFDPSAFGQHQIEIGKQIAGQIAGGIASAHQYSKLERESRERKQIAEISRIVNSTLDFDSVFTAFAEAARELVPFDRLAISMINAQNRKIYDAYVAGKMIPHGNSTGPLSLEESVLPTTVYEDHEVLVANAEELAERAKTDVTDGNRTRVAAGLISTMFVPVVLQGTIVGALVFRSFQPDPYHEVEVDLAKQIAVQIAGVIASTQQRSLLQTESAGRRKLAEEQSRIAEIGRIVSSTLDLDEVFSLVVEQVRELVPFDRLVIILLSEDRQTLIDEFVDGLGTKAGIRHDVGYNPLQLNVIESGTSFVSNSDDHRDFGSREFDKHLLALGLKSVLVSSLKWQKNVVGLLSFRSKEVHPYNDHEIELANQIGAQIAGAVSTSKQYQLLATSEASYRDIVESGHILVWRMDAEGRFSYVNKTVEDILGYSSGELIGALFWDLQPSQSRDLSEKHYKLRASNSERNSGETIYVTKSGSEVHLSFSSFPEFDADGNFLSSREIALDVTAERAALDDLKIQNAALEEAGDAVVILLPDTTIGYVNSAFVKQMGYSKAEVIGQPSSILRSSSSSDTTYENIWEVARQGNIWRGTIFSQRKDGTIFTIDASLSPVLAEDGSITSYVSIRRDVTERIQAERDRQVRAELDAQNQQLQEMNTQREEFFTTVSHELRTPLTAVTAFSDILSRNRAGNLTDGQLEQLNVIRRNSRSLINLVEDVLDMSRLNSRSIRIDLAALDVDAMVRSIGESLGPTAREREQTITIESNTKDVWINADKSRLIQVFSNLITNACKYSPKGSRINILTTTDGKSVEFCVVDSGYGMSAADLRSAFSPFYRSERDEIRAQSGTGLGMSISKTLVELHDGQIDVQSEINVGTTVTVKIPGVIPPPSPQN
ncbi:MAG: PAS domain S-box protein [Chloroflexi bacterium]|nr:PAS domain S-box protein [Chloroflexota bacterium]